MNNRTEDLKKGTTRGEQRYLKELYMFAMSSEKLITTSVVASLLGVNPASATDMLKKLAAKKLLYYSPYHGCRLTRKGKRAASIIARKSRLVELFLEEKLGISTGETREIADFMSALQSPVFFEKIDELLGYPFSSREY